jgi:AI-2 transport protein TqsA
MKSTLREEQIWLVVSSLMIIAAVALAAGLIYTKVVLVPFVLAVFLTTVVSPIVDFQVLRCKIPQTPALVLALVLIVIFLCVFCIFLIGAADAIVTTAGDYAKSFKDEALEYAKSLKDSADKISWLKEWTDNIKFDKIIGVAEQQLPGAVTQVAGTGTALITNLIANGFLITFFVIFLLAGRNSHHKSSGLIKDIEVAVRRYIITKFVVSAATGVLVWLILSAFKLPMALVFGLLTFLLNFIPNIGSIIATFLPLPLAMAQPFSIWQIIGVVAIPGALQMAVGNLLEPRLLGRGLELHPVTILMALAFWGLMWGYMGMVLAVPITAIIRVVLIRFETTRAIGDLLAGKLPS